MTLLKAKLIALLLALTLAGTANAATESSTSALTFSGGNAFFGNTIAAGFSAFDDFFTFSVPAANTGNVGASVIAGFSSSPGSFGWTSVITAFDLFSGTPGSGTLITLGTVYGGIAGTTGAFGLLPGNYFLNVQGSIPNPAAGGSYGGAANLVLTPVPEPGEWALMMSGLGLIGFMVRRRTSRSA